MHNALEASVARGNGLSGDHNLVAFHRRIEERLAGLRRSRGGRPVYGLEHGLGPAEITRLSQLVGHEIRNKGIGNNFNGSYLALIAAASEVGYEYRGTGTDFWPKFEASLGARVASQERERITEFFDAAHRLQGIRKPAETPWTRAFRHIAWPIVNAVAPKEIHRALARTLRESYRLTSDVPDEEVLVGRLRSIAGRASSPRLVQWLENGDLAAAVAWRLLEQTDPLARVADDTLGRVFGDLVTDTVSRRAVSSAAELHRRRVLTTPRRSVAPGTARLVMNDRGDGKAELGIRFPYLADTDRRAIRSAMASASGKIRLWGMSDPVDAERLLSGYNSPLGDIDLKAVTDSTTSFISLLPDAPDELVQTALQIAPSLSIPIVLARTGHSEQFTQTALRTIPRGAFRILLAGSLVPPVSAIPKGLVGGLRCFEFEQSTPEVASWLEANGLGQARSASIEFAGPVLLGHDLLGPVFAEGRPVLVKLSGGNSRKPATFTMRSLPPAVVPGGSLLAICDASVGAHVIEVEIDGEQIRAGFTIVRTDPADAVLAVSLNPPAPTADDLVDGRLGLHVRSALQLGSAEIEIVASDSGTEVARVSQRVAGWPVSIGPSSPLMLAFTEQVRRSGMSRSSKPELSIVVGKAWHQRWPLAWELRHCEWERIDGEWRALTEAQDLPLATSKGFDPFDTTDDIWRDDASPLLQTPLLDGAPLFGEALCTAPATMQLGTFPINVPERLLREPGSRGSALGIVPCVEAWLGWSSAKSEHVIAEYGRRQVAGRIEQLAVSQICGERWSAIEASGSIIIPNRWMTLTRVAMARSLAAGGMLPEIPVSEQPRLEQFVAEALEEARPDLWELPILQDTKADPDLPDPTTVEQWEALASELDLAVIDAYEKFAMLLVSEGQPSIEDPDANNDAELWMSAIRQARDLQRTVSFRAQRIEALILPGKRAHALITADYSRLAESDVVSVLIDNHVDLIVRQPYWLGPDALATAVNIWIDPRSVASRPDWKDHIQRLLADRQTARAARYVALRYRAARNMDSNT
ncbi:hypothetical protein [Sandaracinobacteroides hominis]|uniref:hypothetical protein n=1 Tax=Sandaracinobacteroides hominis TaxID=2780086 RepID=UPI0018F3A622|nr:hypothetical protein [Sandaracinobacteroides hominis]